MKIFLTISLTIFLFINTCSAQQTTLFEKKAFIRQNDTLPYRLLAPENANTKKKYPLLVLLHGSGSRGNDNEKQLRAVPESFLSEENRKRFPCYLLVPQCPANDVWVNFPDFPQSLKATDTPTHATRMLFSLIRELTATLNMDTNRIYITGYSMGGEGTFDMISREPELFAAAVPICPVADTAKAGLLKDNAIWIFHGADDQVNEVKYSRMMVDALKKGGGHPIYTEYPGVGHQSWPKAYSEPDLLPWMFSHTRTNHSRKK